MSQTSSSLARNAAVAAVVTLVINFLGGGLQIVGNTPRGQRSGGTGSVLQTWSSSGAQVGQMNASGSLVLSGATVLNHGKAGSGKIYIDGTDGAGVCQADDDGAGCTCNSCANGTCRTYPGATTDCQVETYR